LRKAVVPGRTKSRLVEEKMGEETIETRRGERHHLKKNRLPRPGGRPKAHLTPRGNLKVDKQQGRT